MMKPGLIFLFALFCVSVMYNFHEILFFPPYSIHAWRQADCLSFALNFFNENLNFFQPQINGLGDSGNGKTVSEFPIIYYSVAKLWKIFGQHEFIFRLINLCIVFLGLFNLHRLSRSVLKDQYFAMFIPLFLFTSPVLVYYSNNFLADAPAFALALSGCYYLYKYLSLKDKKSLWPSILFFLLGGLIKITSLLIFFSITGALALEALINYRQIDRVRVRSLIASFFAIMVPIVCWFFYTKHYNQNNNNDGGFFLQSIFPIWDTTPEERKYIFTRLFTYLMPAFFNRVALTTVVLLFISILVFYKKVNRFLLFVCIFCSIGVVAYFILWFKAFDVHDYYMTNLLIFIPLTLVTFFEFFSRTYPKVFYNTRFRVALTMMLFILTYQTALINRLKYDSHEYFGSNFLINKNERASREYYHWAYSKDFKAFETIKPYLRSIGISRTDKVLCLSDESINISLYLMDQKGYTKYGYARFSDKERVEFAISKGCKYLILRDDQTNELQEVKPLLAQQVGQYKNIEIYSLAKPSTAKE